MCLQGFFNLNAKDRFLGEFIICLSYIFWEMTRQENNNLIYPLQFASVRKKMFRLLNLRMKPLPLFFSCFCRVGLRRRSYSPSINKFCFCKILVKCKRCIHFDSYFLICKPACCQFEILSQICDKTLGRCCKN